MDGSDERGLSESGGDGGWPAGDDPADQWILDPVTGEYRMRLPGERPPPRAPETLPAPRATAELELRSRRTELEPAGSRASRAAASRTTASRTTGSRAAGSRAGASRAAGGSRAAARRGGRRRGAGGSGGLWVAGVLGLVGLLGCGTGGYLLLHGGAAPKDCAAAPAVPAAAPSTAPPATAEPLPPGPSADPINVRVTVLNGSGQIGAAEAVLQWMQNDQNYNRTSNGGPARITATTTLVYAPNHVDQARTLAAAMHLPPSALHGTSTHTGYYDPMILTLGKDFRAAGKPLAPPPAPKPTPTRSAVRPSGCPA